MRPRHAAQLRNALLAARRAILTAADAAPRMPVADIPSRINLQFLDEEDEISRLEARLDSRLARIEAKIDGLRGAP